MNKFKRMFRSIFPILFVSALMGFFVVGVYAASTIGTNMVTAGTVHVGGDAAQTKFEVQGTASASYFLTGNTIQVGGYASVAYNRFGTTATTEAHYISTTNDVLVNGDLEVDGSASFAGPASISNTLYIGTMGKTGNVGVGTTSPAGQFDVNGGKLIVLSGGNVGIGTTVPQAVFDFQAGLNAYAFIGGQDGQGHRGVKIGQDASGFAYIQGIANLADTPKDLSLQLDGGFVGVGTQTPQTKFEVQGTASASYLLTGNTLQVGGYSSVAYSRFGTATTTE